MIDHLYLTSMHDLDRPIKGFYQEIQAGNGRFIRAKRDGLEAIIRVSGHTADFCLPIYESVKVERKISAAMLDVILTDFREYLPNERLAWIMRDGSCVFPAQAINPGFVSTIDEHNPEIGNVIYDVHSHNTMDAYFSDQDNRDESNGFRIFIVVGKLDMNTPQIRARVGIFGHFQEIPIESVASIPFGINMRDVHETA